MTVLDRQCGPRGRGGSTGGVAGAGCGLRAWRCCTVRRGWWARWGAGRAVIVVECLAAVLAVAAVGYLVVALVHPERF
ncbi:potassium-transporting ATPase subunit F [Arthrobacter sp.]|uniref:potassium-transporting ATPase subunit F n=1 Tax=Arthrobacter sp. TaxID=1667 RepID=UPI003A8F8BBC